jgi:hypothetical protein
MYSFEPATERAGVSSRGVPAPDYEEDEVARDELPHMADRERVRRELHNLVHRVAADVHLWHTVHGSSLDEAEKIAARNGMDLVDIMLDEEDLLHDDVGGDGRDGGRGVAPPYNPHQARDSTPGCYSAALYSSNVGDEVFCAVPFAWRVLPSRSPV